jgi:hypothetical protein
MPDHAKLSPSSAKTWLRCPGAPELCAQVVDTGGKDADYGTACHELAERRLLGEDIETLIGQKAREVDVEFSQDMLELVYPVTDWVLAYVEAHDAKLYTERKVEIGESFGLAPGLLFGTTDVNAIGPKECLIGDFKFGYSAVEVTDNEQLLLYVFGALSKFLMENPGLVLSPDFRVRLAILQPRVGAPTETVYSIAEIQAKHAELEPKVMAAAAGGALIQGEDQCRWCKARGVCPELREQMVTLARREFLSELVNMTPVELSDLLKKLALVEAASSAVWAHALKVMELGVEIPGWKRALGNTKRKWISEGEAAKGLKKRGVDPYDKKLITPAEAERRLTDTLIAKAKKKLTKTAAGAEAKKLLSDLSEHPEGKPTIVRASDVRPALPSAFEGFVEVEKEHPIPDVID